MRRFDLHLHSTLSDGTLPPEQVLERCAASGLDAVALTDHDLVAGPDPGPHRFGAREVHLIHGAEVSGVHDGREFHLLVYFPRAAPTSFREFCHQRARHRAIRYEQAVAVLGLPGIPAADRVAREGGRSLTRLHLAHALVDAGHAESVGDAFARFTGDAHGNVPPIDLPFIDAIRIARDAGGVTSWAHPTLRHAQRYVAEFVAAGLQGLEALRPRLDRTERKGLKKLAKRHGLFLTGGSDWHGWYGHELGLFHTTRWELEGFLAALQAA